MAELSQAQRQALQAVMEAAPPRLLMHVEAAFRSTPGPNGAFVRAMARNLSVERTARAEVFEPISPLFRSRPDGVRAESFPAAAERAVWALLTDRRPEAVERLREALKGGAQTPEPELLDALAQAASEEVHSCAPEDLGLADADQREALAACLEMTPRARLAINLVESWTSVQLDDIRLQQIEHAFREAAQVRYDGPARLMEILFAHMPDASVALRFVSAVSRVGGGEVVRDAEVADFGERLVEFVEALAADLASLLKSEDHRDAETIAQRLTRTAAILMQFDFVGWRPRPDWSARLAKASQSIGTLLDSYFRSVASKVGKALPRVSAPLAGRMSRKTPNLSADAASQASERARAALIVTAGARSFAPITGCEAIRQKAGRLAGDYVDRYADEVLTLLADPDAPHREQAERLLELAAEYLDRLQSGDAGDLIRRRLAIARLERPEEAA